VLAIESTRFGKIEIDESIVLEFESGMIGFPEHRRYAILKQRDDSVFMWLHSIDDGGLAFACRQLVLYRTAKSAAEQLEPLGTDADKPFLEQAPWLIAVFAFVLYLYVGPLLSWVSTYKQAGEKRQEVAALKARNTELKDRRKELRDKRALEREARRLGMVKAGEKAYVVRVP